MVIIYKTTNGFIQKKTIYADIFVCDNEFVKGNVTIFAIWAIQNGKSIPIIKLKSEKHRDLLYKSLQKDVVSVCSCFPAEYTDYEAFKLLYYNGVGVQVLRFILQGIDKSADAFLPFTEEEIRKLKQGEPISLVGKNITEISSLWADTLRTISLCKIQKLTYRQLFLYILLCMHSSVQDVLQSHLSLRRDSNFSETLLRTLEQEGILYKL